MTYIFELPEVVQEMIVAIQKKNLQDQGYGMMEIEEAEQYLLDSKVSDVDISEMIEVINN